MRSGRCGAAAALMVVLAAACERTRGPSDTAGADALTGTWTAELVVTQPLAARGNAGLPTAHGTISLLRDDDGRRMRGLSGPATHVGAQTVHLRPFGFEARPGGEVPGVAARWIAPDSVELAFESASPDQAFVIRGRLTGDSIAGRWHYTSRGAGGALGRVVMRRSR
ncbi:MAG TPA: hypothetical protein VFR37_07860 [Longimicrobium sp.]|nr:hypothetical protein [Longimicrobium sp.]